jgi:hypothetical protein
MADLETLARQFKSHKHTGHDARKVQWKDLADVADLTAYVRHDGSTAYTGTGAGFKDEDNMASDSDTATASQQSIKAYIATAVADYVNKDGSTAYTGTGAGFKDEDDMSSDSATATASQQSIKAYIATQVGTTVDMVVGEDVAIREAIYQDNYGFHLLTDASSWETTNHYKGVASAAATGATESGVGAGSDHEHYTVASSTDYVASDTTPATIIIAAANTNTSNLDTSNNTDYDTTTSTAGEYCYQLIHWDTASTATDTVQRIKVLVEASAGGTGQTSGWSCYVWDFTNTEWDLVGTSTESYATDETIQAAFDATDYVDGSDNCYVLIKTTAAEVGGVNDMNLDVDYASLMVGVNCATYIDGNVTGFGASSFVSGLTAYLSDTAGGITTDPTEATVKKAIGVASSTTSITLFAARPDVEFPTSFILPSKATSITTNTAARPDLFGQSDTAGEVAMGFYDTATSIDLHVLRPHFGNPLLLASQAANDVGGHASGAGNAVLDVCQYSGNYLLSNTNGNIYRESPGGGSDWSTAITGPGGICTDGTYVWVYSTDGTNDRLYRRNYSNGNAVDNIASIGFTYKRNNNYRCGAFYYKDYVYVIAIGTVTNDTNQGIEVAKIDAYNMTVDSVSVIASDTTLASGSAAPYTLLGTSFRFSDFIMPYPDEGVLYGVYEYGNMYIASPLVNIEAL